MSLLEIKKLHAGYGAIKVLRDISIEINNNEVVTILGPNGAGKTTLVMTIFNAVHASHGEINFNNINITNIPTHDIAKLGISLVPEGRRIFSKMSVYENLILGGTAIDNIDKKILNQIYEYFPILKKRINQTAGTLSGGEQQMLAIGRALLAKPKLLILDEPSLGLSPKITMQIFEILDNIAKNGTTILLIEQNINYATKVANRFYILSNGEVKKTGNTKDFNNDDSILNYYFGH